MLPQVLGSHKGHAGKPEEGEVTWGLGDAQRERGLELGRFPDTFQRTEAGALFSEAKNSAKPLQILFYLVLSLAHSFWLNKVSSFPVPWSLITRA